MPVGTGKLFHFFPAFQKLMSVCLLTITPRQGRKLLLKFEVSWGSRSSEVNYFLLCFLFVVPKNSGVANRQVGIFVASSSFLCQWNTARFQGVTQLHWCSSDVKVALSLLRLDMK